MHTPSKSSEIGSRRDMLRKMGANTLRLMLAFCYNDNCNNNLQKSLLLNNHFIQQTNASNLTKLMRISDAGDHTNVKLYPQLLFNTQQSSLSSSFNPKGTFKIIFRTQGPPAKMNLSVISGKKAPHSGGQDSTFTRFLLSCHWLCQVAFQPAAAQGTPQQSLEEPWLRKASVMARRREPQGNPLDLFRHYHRILIIFALYPIQYQHKRTGSSNRLYKNYLMYISIEGKDHNGSYANFLKLESCAINIKLTIL